MDQETNPISFKDPASESKMAAKPAASIHAPDPIRPIPNLCVNWPESYPPVAVPSFEPALFPASVEHGHSRSIRTGIIHSQAALFPAAQPGAAEPALLIALIPKYGEMAFPVLAMI